MLLLALFSAAVAPTALQHALEPGSASKGEAQSALPSPELRKRETEAKLKPWEEFLCSYFYPQSRKDQRYCPETFPPLEAQFLIAGTPDPEVTSVPATFDVMVESIMRAAAFHNWRYDRYWVPWVPGKRATMSPTAADPVQSNNEPGLLLFRRIDGILVVFLVGETPTSGVNKTAFVNAAEFILARAPNQPLRVLGPRFSGSVDSYKIALNALERNAGYAGATLISGSATRAANKEDFDLISTLEKPVNYSATVENDARTTEQFLDWLGTRGISRRETAILAEAGTAFGAAQVQASGNDVFSIEFPYQISRLRNAYEQDPELRAIWMGRSKEARQQRLDWSLKTDKEGTDRLPSFNGPQTALTQEREMEQIMDTIRRRGIRAAGISSTDILDTVFISIMLQRYCPGVRTFILDSDLLFLYSSPSLSFHGMLMVSPYPLWPENQRMLHWQEDTARRLQTFPNRSALAVFNAFLLLMSGRPGLEYGSPAEAMTWKPPVWVTAVGRGEVWPIGLLSKEKPGLPESSLAKPDDPLENREPAQPAPHWSYLMLMTVCIGITAYGGWIYAQRQLKELFPGGGWDRAFFFLFEPPEDSAPRTIYLQTICLFGATALLPFCLGGWAAAGTASLPWVWPAFAAVAATLAVFGHVTFTAPRPLAAFFAAAVLLLLVCGSWLFWIHDAFGPAQHATMEHAFFGHRLLNPLSGVSPLAGFVLPWFACCWWAVSKFNQLRTQEVRSPRIGSWPVSEPLLAETGPAIQRACLNAEAAVHPSFLAPFAIWVLELFWVFPSKGLSGLEPETGIFSWTTGVQTAVILLGLFITLTIWQMFQTYKGLETVLNGFIDHPLSDAMGRLPKDLAASQLWLRGNNRFPFQTCLQGVLRLRVLSQRGFPGAPDALTLAGLEAKLRCLLEYSSSGRRLQRDEVAGLHRDFNAVSFSLYPQLARIWAGSAAADDASAKAEEFVALRIAALVRYLVMQMRSMLEYLSLAVLLFIAGVVSYPFEPQQGLVYWIAGLAAACGAGAFYVVGRLDAHPVLQPLNAKAQGGFDLLRKLAFYGSAPALAAMGALFPGSARTIQSLLEQLPKLFSGG